MLLQPRVQGKTIRKNRFSLKDRPFFVKIKDTTATDRTTPKLLISYVFSIRWQGAPIATVQGSHFFGLRQQQTAVRRGTFTIYTQEFSHGKAIIFPKTIHAHP